MLRNVEKCWFFSELGSWPSLHAIEVFGFTRYMLVIVDFYGALQI